MKKITVVICINDFLIGGAQRMLADMLHHLDRNAFEPVLITLFYWEGKEYFYELLPSDVPVHRLAFRGFWDVRSWTRLGRLLREISPDVVLSNLFFSNAVIRILKLFLGYKVIIVEHNTYVRKTKLHQIVDRVLAHLTARIVAVSNTVAAFTARQERIPKEKFIVVHNGIDIRSLREQCERIDRARAREEFGIAGGDTMFLNVARLTTQKNPLLLLEGFARFVAHHPRSALVMVGGGGKWGPALAARAKELGIAARVHFVGARKDVARFYAIADFFVSTSVIEGFGIAHAEALACGVPVLSTKTAGPDEMIREGENGYFIAEPTPESVAEGMERIARADRAAMSARARESAEAYSIERATRAYEDLFRAAARA